MRRIVLFGLGALVMGGCATGVTASDSAQVRSDFSQDKYEAAMKAAGKGAELQKEKEAAAARGGQ
jgi:hypothetical protein